MPARSLSPWLLTAALAAPALAQKPMSDAQQLAAACNQFAAELHPRLDGNPTCSPTSIAIALLMLLPGARGDTAAELAHVLHLPADLRGARLERAAGDLLRELGILTTGSPNRDVPLSPLWITNDLWVQTGSELNVGYTDALRSSFAAGLWPLDFRRDHEAARVFINDHIAKATNDRIRDLLQPGLVLPSTRLVLTNALWFKASWEHTFSKKATADAPFVRDDGNTVHVPTMAQTDQFAYAEAPGWQCLSMAFREGSIVCDLLLPRAETTLPEAERVLLSGSYVDALRGERVKVWLPRFTVSGQHDLQKALSDLGVRAAFTTRADFTGITTEEPLLISEIVHRTWIQVDEDGAEAAAATATVLRAGAKMPQGEPKQFRADHPFAFVLRDRRTGLVLFVGRVTDPQAQQG